MWIIRTNGDADGATFRLMPGAVKTLGRATRADFIVDAALVSRLHCRFTVQPSGELEIEDLRSTNGTYVNDKRVRKTQLTNGDLVRIGRLQLAVQKS